MDFGLSAVTAAVWPKTLDAVVAGIFSRSPNEAFDFLNPVVPAFAILLLVTASSVLAAFNPVSDVKNDIFVFYVIGTNKIQGIFKVNGEWYDSKYEWPDSNIRDYKSEVKLELIKTGIYQTNKKENIDKLDFFTKKDDVRLRNLKLKGMSGYPSNNKEPISEKDYQEILNSMLEVVEKTETVKIEREEDVRDIIIGELEKDMIGPRYGPDELLPKYVTPNSTYFAGILFPQEIPDVEDEVNQQKDDEDVIEGDTKEINTKDEGAILDQAIYDKDFASEYSCALVPQKDRITLRILLDWSSVEVFANNGELVLSALIFPTPFGGGITIFVEISISYRYTKYPGIPGSFISL